MVTCLSFWAHTQNTPASVPKPYPFRGLLKHQRNGPSNCKLINIVINSCILMLDNLSPAKTNSIDAKELHGYYCTTNHKIYDLHMYNACSCYARCLVKMCSSLSIANTCITIMVALVNYCFVSSIHNNASLASQLKSSCPKFNYATITSSHIVIILYWLLSQNLKPQKFIPRAF